jgi:hypothetical protein
MCCRVVCSSGLLSKGRSLGVGPAGAVAVFQLQWGHAHVVACGLWRISLRASRQGLSRRGLIGRDLRDGPFSSHAVASVYRFIFCAERRLRSAEAGRSPKQCTLYTISSRQLYCRENSGREPWHRPRPHFLKCGYTIRQATHVEAWGEVGVEGRIFRNAATRSGKPRMSKRGGEGGVQGRIFCPRPHF